MILQWAVRIIGYRLFYVWEVAVTDFYGVPIEDFAQFLCSPGKLCFIMFVA